jgi:lysozyme family protein
MDPDTILEWVQSASVDRLRSLTSFELQALAAAMGPRAPEFLFAKNIRIFGGINEYVDDYLTRGPLVALQNMPQNEQKTAIARSHKLMLERMKAYPAVSDANKTRIDHAIAGLSGAAAAAGGRRKRKTLKARKARKTKRRTF